MADSKSPEQQDAHQEKHGIGSVIADFFGSHKALAIGAAVGFGIVALVLYSSQKSASTGASTSTTGSTSSPSCIDQTSGQSVPCSQQGSLSNAGYQDSGVAYALTQLGQQLNNLTANLGTPGATGPAGPPGQPGGCVDMNGTPVPCTSGGANPPIGLKGPIELASRTFGNLGRLWGTTATGQRFESVAPGGTPGSPGQTDIFYSGTYTLVKNAGGYLFTPGNYPLVPQGTSIPSTGGAHYNFGGQWYTIVPGGGGRIYGVPGQLTYEQAKQQQGVLLMAPKSYYTQPTTPQASHSPLLTGLSMAKHADWSQDLSHPGISGSPVSQRSINSVGIMRVSRRTQ